MWASSYSLFRCRIWKERFRMFLATEATFRKSEVLYRSQWHRVVSRAVGHLLYRKYRLSERSVLDRIRLPGTARGSANALAACLGLNLVENR